MLGWRITKCGNNGLQSVLGVGLQSVAGWITKCVRDYKVWQGGLQNALGITKCDKVDYKVRQELQSVAGLQSELVQIYERHNV